MYLFFYFLILLSASIFAMENVENNLLAYKDFFTIKEPTCRKYQEPPLDILAKHYGGKFPADFENFLKFLRERQQDPKLSIEQVKIPNIFLFEGKACCGKTYLAELIASELQIPFIKVYGTDIAFKLSLRGTALLHRLFETRDPKNRTLLLLIDMIEGIGRGTDQFIPEQQRMFSALFNQLNAHHCDPSILVIGTTSSSHFMNKKIADFFIGKTVEFMSMSTETRAWFLTDLCKDLSIVDKEKALELLVKETDGLTKGNLARAINTAVLSSIRMKTKAITYDQISKCIKEGHQASVPNNKQNICTIQ